MGEQAPREHDVVGSQRAVATGSEALGSARATADDAAKTQSIWMDVLRHLAGATSATADHEIERSLVRVGRYSSAERSYLYLRSGDTQRYELTHEWYAPGVAPMAYSVGTVDDATLPTILPMLRAGSEVYIPEVEGMSGTQAAERDLLLGHDVHSMLLVPMMHDSELEGFVGIDALKAPHYWNQSHRAMLGFVAEVFAETLKRTVAEAEARTLYLAMQKSPVGAVVFETDGTVLWCNDSFSDISGHTRGELHGHASTKAPFGLYDEALRREMLDAVLAGKVWKHHAEMNRTTGEPVVVSMKDFAIEDGSGEMTRIVSLVRDVTAETELVASLRCARVEAESASKAKTRFLATMSHEIRTPMNSILGCAELLAESELTDEQRENVDVLAVNGRHLLALIDDILDLSKVEAGRMELDTAVYDIRDLVESINSIVGAKARSSGLEFRVHVNDDVPAFNVGDDHRLRQVLVNLSGNAVKFTAEGSVSIDVSMAELPEGPAIEYAVSDTGIGIAPDKLGAVFEPFKQAETSTTRKFGGSGLGLAISRDLTEAMGGAVTVESELGSGATFRVRVPLVEPEPGEVPTGLARAGAAGGLDEECATPEELGAIRVLIVDDAPDNLRLARAFLKSTPFVVETLEDGQQALDAVRHEPWNVVLLDMQMPVLDGYETVQAIRALGDEQCRTTPVVALTAFALGEEIQRAMDCGCDGYLTKPVSKKDLLRTIATYTRREIFEPVAPVERVTVDPDIADLIGDYLEHRRDDVSTLRDAIAQGDWTTVRRLSHDMTGSGGAYGFDRITEWGRELNAAAHAEDAQAAAQIVDAVDAYLGTVVWEAGEQ